jgi:uncharacterized Tic20 family protein
MSSYAEPAASASASPASMDYAASEATGSTGTGWIAFSGVILILAGFTNLVDGLWALDASDSPAISDRVEDFLWYTNNLETWGWIYSILGGVLILVGIGVFSRNQFARWIGIAVAATSAVINMMWVFVYPIPALIHVSLAAMVIYGLTAYGERETTPEGA